MFLNTLCQQRTNLSTMPWATSVLFSISSLYGWITVRVTLGPICPLCTFARVFTVAACGQRSADNPFTWACLWAPYITPQIMLSSKVLRQKRNKFTWCRCYWARRDKPRGEKNNMLLSHLTLSRCVCTLLSNLICEKLWGFDCADKVTQFSTVDFSLV